MLNMTAQGIEDTAAWEQAGVSLPKYDRNAMCAETKENCDGG